jgi:hypothetical protein
MLSSNLNCIGFTTFTITSWQFVSRESLRKGHKLHAHVSAYSKAVPVDAKLLLNPWFGCHNTYGSYKWQAEILHSIYIRSYNYSSASPYLKQKRCDHLQHCKHENNLVKVIWGRQTKLLSYIWLFSDKYIPLIKIKTYKCSWIIRLYIQNQHLIFYKIVRKSKGKFNTILKVWIISKNVIWM